jgi:ERCC4-type nuclease
VKRTYRSDDLVPIVDSREKRPFELPNSVVACLPAGDYSLLGFEERIAIERKSKEDAYKSLGYGRRRFEREVRKLANYDYAAIVVEASLPDFLVPPEFSRMRPRSAICSLLGWSVKYRIPVFFCSDRAHAKATTWQLLKKFARYVEEGVIENA